MNVVCLAGCDFNATWQPTQEIMTRLAQLGHQVLYINPTGTRYPRLSDLSRLWKRRQAQVSHSNLTVYSPMVLPFPFSWIAARINRRILMRRVRQWLQGQPCDIVWAWFASPLNVQVIGALKAKKVVYQIMSSICAVRSQSAIHEAEDKLMSHATAIFVNSDTLRQEYGRRHTETYVFRAGCNTALFDPKHIYKRPHDMPTGKPIIGYCGGTHTWVDLSLVINLCERLPQYDFVMVGPAALQESGRWLPRTFNLFWLGSKAHNMLPFYLSHFDVCLIPYKADAYTATSFPAKLNEYLAMGKPVVAIRTPELETFAKEFEMWLGLSSTVEEFASNIELAFAIHTPLRSRCLRSVALQHDYNHIIPKMLKVLA